MFKDFYLRLKIICIRPKTLYIKLKALTAYGILPAASRHYKIPLALISRYLLITSIFKFSGNVYTV
ncbi:hypothetical protein SAMN05421846_103121 [Chryseobacterium taeanense]|uniref:Uncharacterized protein n=1 Tax=Chryseobacterium taeanense TaxID=311334 RepID=A0A1G8GUZ7_9FLAO|nr:hypothetical protein SAMN05421846_103121 [Chryseobacterium taeanense]